MAACITQRRTEKSDRLIKRDRRWPEPKLLTPRSSKKSWGKLLREIAGYDPFRDAKGFEFKPVRAHRAMRFFHDELSHAKGERARTPFWLERLEQTVIANLFGSVDRRGRRRYLYLFLYVPLKNSNTPLYAAMAWKRHKYCLDMRRAM